MSVATESITISEIRQSLEYWLNKDQWTFQDLRRWVKGHELPSLGYETEPYVWILRSLPDSANHRHELANRIASFLKQSQAHPIPNQEFNDSFFYNLLHICAGLGCRQELGRPLRDLYSFFTSHNNEREVFFSERRPYNLNNAFREALITNQIDASFRDIWRSGLEGQQASFLLGDFYSCFRGIVYLSNNNQPAIEDIGWALGKMAEYLDPEKDRHQKFRRLLERVKEAWPEETFNQDWDQILMLQSMANNWMPWATVRLNKLAIPVRRSFWGGDRVLIWSEYLPFLRQSRIPFKEISSKYLFAEINISSSRKLMELLSRIEAARASAPFRSYRGVIQATNEIFYMNLLDEEEANTAALESVRIETFSVAATDPARSGEKQIEAKKALARTVGARQ
jgi:hypothetical protein